MSPSLSLLLALRLRPGHRCHRNSPCPQWQASRHATPWHTQDLFQVSLRLDAAKSCDPSVT
eukprot:1639782-Rhodomonas_salina.1